MSDAKDIYIVAKTLLFQKYDEFSTEVRPKKQIKIYRDFLDLLNCLVVGSVLFEMDKARFSKHLMRMAEVGRHFLLQQKEKGTSVPSSYNQSFIAALCLQQYDLANEIANLSAGQIVKPEYDDEFLFNQLMFSLLNSVVQKKPVDVEVIGSICETLDEYLEENSLELVFYQVLIDEGKTTEDLSDALIEWHDELYADFKNKQKMEKGSAWFPLTGRLWLKGLAVINLCDALQIPLTQRLTLIPDLLCNNAFSESQNDIFLGRVISVAKEEL